ncbi:MAG: serine/threonine-protein kinase, partial [Gemmataceae bacterium]
MPVRIASQEEPLPGYRLIERIGRGGFGEVWKVEAPGGLLKAMKFVFGDLEATDDESTRAAEQELKALERVKMIRHPYILSLEQYRIVDGQLMIVMELADRNLWDRFRECRALGMPGIPREELLKYMDEASEALDLMNNHYHIQHLDVKPQNLFLVFNHVKVADFGLAKAFEGVRGTVTGGVTPVYAAPETFEGFVSRYTDQYSLAIVFQELLCGTRPFNGSNTKQLLMQHLNGTPDVESLPFSDQPIVMRGLAKKPEHRYPSCTDMVKALRAAGTMAPASTPKPPSQAIGSDSVVMTRAAHLLGSETPPKGSGDYPTTVPPSAHSPVVAIDKLRLTTPARPSGPLLVTPRLVTPKDANGQIAQTPVRQPVVQTSMMGSLGIADRERAESGVLQPAFFIALGQLGHELLCTIQGTLRDRFGTLDTIPHVRFLTIDTDPILMEKATGTEPIPEAELLLTRMNRPQHYLSKEGLPSVEAWLPPGALYKL